MAALGLGVGEAAQALLPQRPDGDATALAEFTQHTAGTFWQQMGMLNVREQFWYALAGALLALWLVDWLLQGGWRRWPHILAALGGLLWLSGWMWNMTAGWQGRLFLAPETTISLPRGGHALTFERFLTPPAPDGEGRALHLRVRWDGEPFELREQAPLWRDGWLVRPRWYGAVVWLGEDAHYFGGDGAQYVRLPDGRLATVQVDIETLSTTINPTNQVPPVRAAWYAVLDATYMPGRWLMWAGWAGMASGAALWGVRRAWRW